MKRYLEHLLFKVTVTLYNSQNQQFQKLERAHAIKLDILALLNHDKKMLTFYFNGQGQLTLQI